MPLLLLAALLALPAVPAGAATIEVENQSSARVALGSYYGFKVPSLCEDGFCWEEVNVWRVHPYAGFDRIRGLARLELGGRERDTYLEAEGVGSFGFTGPCESVKPEQRAYVYALDGAARLRDISFRAICLTGPKGRLVID